MALQSSKIEQRSPTMTQTNPVSRNEIEDIDTPYEEDEVERVATSGKWRDSKSTANGKREIMDLGR